MDIRDTIAELWDRIKSFSLFRNIAAKIKSIKMPGFLRGLKGHKSSEQTASHNDVKVEKEPLSIPNPLHTVIAVVICCVVLIGVGIALYGIQQREMQTLRGDLQEYGEVGVVPASTIEDSVTVNIEAISARITYLQNIIDKGKKDGLSSKRLRWLAGEMEEVRSEADTVSSIINRDNLGRKISSAFDQEVRSPLADLEDAYDGVTINEKDAVNTAVSQGAANETGEFKTNPTSAKSVFKWIIPCVVLGLVLAALGVVLIKRRSRRKAHKK